MKCATMFSAAILGLLLCFSAASAQERAGADGERLFRSRCGSCHGLNTGENRVGPHLSGLFGRAAGSVAGARYSNALSTSGFIWDEERLHAYLNNPRQVVPGTTMSASVRDQAQRSAIITYLQSLSAEPPN